MKEFKPGDKVEILTGEYAGQTGVIVGQRTATHGARSRPIPEGGDLPKPAPDVVYDVQIGKGNSVRGIRPGSLKLVKDD